MKNPCLGPRTVKFLLLFLILAFILSGCGLFRSGSGVGLAAAKSAKRYVGVPYKYGGQSPKGFDCSGLTAYVYKRHGVKLPRSANKQARVGKPVKKPHLRAGDLVFFSTGKKRQVSHVGIYVGNDKFIHASSSGKKVTTASLSSSYFKKNYHSARRVAM